MQFDIFSFEMPAKKIIAVGLLFILCASSVHCQESEEVPPIIMEPFRLTIEVGVDAKFFCNFTVKSNFTHRISWFHPDNVTEILESNSTRIYVDAESKLNIKNAQLNDSGLYLCKVTFDDSLSTVPDVTVLTTLQSGITVSSATGGSPVIFATELMSNATLEAEMPEAYNATVSLTIYVMPTYFTEGMIILGINLGLLLIFLICLTQSLVSERRRMQTHYKK